MKLPLFARILVWFFVNLSLILGVLVVAFNLQFRLGPRSPLLKEAGNRLLNVGESLTRELLHAPGSTWDAVLQRYSESYKVEFVLVGRDGTRLAGPTVELPPEVRIELDAGRNPPRPVPGQGGDPPDWDRHLRAAPPRPMPEDVFTVRTTNPTRYWAGVPCSLVMQPGRPPVPVVLIARSDSMTGNGLFMDPMPWVVIGIVFAVLSGFLWIPLVRSVTRPLTQMTAATDEIARGKFDIKLDVNRSDEIGRLGRAITDMSTRLDRLIRSQKRLLSDVAHELGSPIARIQIGLGILQNTVEGAHQAKVQDVIDDVEHMSELVEELLAFSRAEVAAADRVHLEPLSVEGVATAVVRREGAPDVDIRISVDPGIRVVADRELLERALANVVRNSVRHAGHAGPIEISAKREGPSATITIRDHGPGVPADSLEKLFDPFYRPEPARRRDTGGTGLGLAIVKTCIAACRGTVTAANLDPNGFALTIRLPAARPLHV